MVGGGRNDVGAAVVIVFGAAMAHGATWVALTPAVSCECPIDARLLAAPAVEWIVHGAPEASPTALEWQVIATYQTIQAMTADQPPLRTVDAALDALERHALQHPENVYIQELYLKGLRVAAYYAADSGFSGRVRRLRDRFDRHYARLAPDPALAREATLFEAQDRAFSPSTR